MRKGVILAALVAVVLVALGSNGRSVVVAQAAVAARPAVRQAQSTEHRAVVVVDTGSIVRTVCIRFTEDSISGVDALQRAGMSPALRTFGGQGAAVCSLCGQGCPTDGSCLTCGGANYWAYYQAKSGAGGFSYSGGGAGSARVRDGDVQGWKWGNGSSPPAFASVESVCGPVAAVIPTTFLTQKPAADAGAVPSAGGIASPQAGSAPVDPAAAPAEPNVAGTAVVAKPGADVPVAPAVVRRSGGSPIVIAVVVGVLVGLVVGLVFTTRRRRIGSTD